MKHTKFLATLGILLAMGLTGCGTNNASKQPASDKSQPQASSAKSQTTSTHTHSFVEDTAQHKDPTCDQPGEKVEKCECGETKKTPIPALGHQWGQATAVEKGDGTLGYNKFECEKNNKADKALKYEIDIGAYVTEHKADYSLSSTPDGFIKFASGAGPLEFTFASQVAGTGKLYLRGIMDHWDGENDEKTLFSGKEGSNYTEKDTTNLEIIVGGQTLISTNKEALNKQLPEIDADHPSAGNAGNTTWSAVGDVEFAPVSLSAGLNTVSYKRVDSYNMAVSHLVFIFTPAA